MKVLILSHMYPSDFSEVKGIFVHQQARALARKGIALRVVSPIPWSPWPIRSITRRWRAIHQIPSHGICDGIPVLYPRYLEFPKLFFSASSGFRMFCGMRPVLRKLHSSFPFDLIHAHVAYPDGYAAAKLAEIFACPFIVTIHGQDFQQTVYKGKRLKNRIARVIEAAGKTIVVSNKLKHRGQGFFPLYAGKFSTVPNGIDPNRMIPARSRTSPRDPSGPLIVSVSNLLEIKGIELNIRAVNILRDRFPGIRYRIVGAGPKDRVFKNLVDSLGLQDRVEFTGPLPNRQALEQMAACDVFSLPSWNEGFGIVYLEAMAHAKPVVGCSGEGIADFVENGTTGMLVEPKNLDSLVSALAFLLDRPDEAEAMGKRARAHVLSGYTWERNAAATIEIYKETLQ